METPNLAQISLILQRENPISEENFLNGEHYHQHHLSLFTHGGGAGKSEISAAKKLQISHPRCATMEEPKSPTFSLMGDGSIKEQKAGISEMFPIEGGSVLACNCFLCVIVRSIEVSNTARAW
ncbi:hypothetical protein CDL12_16492 [Handroanthus impetiginosus]|uniref:Uncharacterized protein n=1 Tax=Handroanthus impetiginosus TaxID=429701 RepID=A0A2G9H074_9LAMI|nr:hypothetical protein CDL12_16492 [Handroanthus impetiginosus]